MERHVNAPQPRILVFGQPKAHFEQDMKRINPDCEFEHSNGVLSMEWNGEEPSHTYPKFFLAGHKGLQVSDREELVTLIRHHQNNSSFSHRFHMAIYWLEGNCSRIFDEEIELCNQIGACDLPILFVIDEVHTYSTTKLICLYERLKQVAIPHFIQHLSSQPNDTLEYLVDESGIEQENISCAEFSLQRLWHRIMKLFEKVEQHRWFIPSLPLLHSHHLTLLQDGQETFSHIATAFTQAKSFIFITGWDLNHEMELVRDGNQQLNVFSMLKKRSLECPGVDVRILLWKGSGFAGSHNKKVQQAFAGTRVKIMLDSNGLSGSHHQKTVVCDVKGSSDIVAFVGGLDMTDGRWDTPSHALFSTLHTHHKKECVMAKEYYGYMDKQPRQPWHDVHMKLDGEGAKQVFENFRERWNELSNEKILETKCKFEKEANWMVQVPRTIKNEMSIASSYLNAIRVSKKFLYLENQYFMGSSTQWPTDCNVCTNSIPQAITEKIIEMAKLGLDYRVYIVTPLFPDGIESLQQYDMKIIIQYQLRTMDYMYKAVAKGLKECHSTKHPTDLLKFFCIGKVEEGTSCPIYVHSKLMIADDEFFMIGSANINDRSMGKDSEICVQGVSVTEGTSSVVKEFRKKLWDEHLGENDMWNFDHVTDDIHRQVCKIGRDNYEHFMSQQQMVGHLLDYPVNVQITGDVVLKTTNLKGANTNASIWDHLGTINPFT